MALSLFQEQELVRRAVEGDEQAYEQLILAYATPLFQVLSRMTADAQEAEALVQEAFWRAWRALERYQTDRPIFPYLVTIAVNLQRDRWQADRWLDQREFESAAEFLPDPIPKPEDQLEHRQRLDYLKKAVNELPNSYRAVLALRYEAELNYEQIALTLSLPVNTVRTHLHRARQQLRAQMEKYDR